MIQLIDKGTIIKVSIKNSDEEIVDISSATSKKLIFEKPDGKVFVVTADFFTDGVDGILKYTTLENEIDQIDLWSVQVLVTLTDAILRSSIGTFEVGRNL